MISILIPVFNRNVTALVASLHQQLSAVKENVEIIVMDDGSDNESLKNDNRNIPTGFDTRYIELPSNTGRNIIRHKLAAAAQYETLIFLDADSSFPDALWLQRYINVLPGNGIVMGGRAYPAADPRVSSLHFHYGQLREQNKAVRRNRHPYRSFLACNFLISRQQLSFLIIDHHLQGYCHEDTFMGLQFEQLNIPVTHIDNPVYHEGIDDDALFMKKQREALENLHYLYRTYHTRYNFERDVKLINVYNKIAAVGAGRYMLDKLAARQSWFKKNTLRSHSLFWLDCWKLAVYHQLSQAPALYTQIKQ